jgi:RHS repeat-associated protein
VPTTTESGPVRNLGTRRCRSWSRRKNSHAKWTRSRGLDKPATTAQPNAADRTWTTSYDTGGLPITDAQPGGVTISRSYDNLGRLLSENGTGTGVAPASRTFGYDLAGLRTSLGTSTGQDTYTYDDRGLLTAASGPSGTASFGYDPAGRLTARTDTAGTSTFTYTPRSQLATATDPLTHTTRTNSYDTAGQLTRTALTGPGGTSSTRSYTFDDLGRLLSDQLASATGTVTASYGYAYDADGNLTSKTINLPGNPANGTHTYSYDHQDRLTGWTTPAGATTSYTWDAAGNRLSVGAASYTYDQRNRQLTGPDGTNTWTPNGNLAGTTNGGGQTASYTYDALSRLVGATSITGQSTSSSYDSLDRLLTTNGAPLSYAGTSIKPVSNGSETYARSIDDSLLAASTGSQASLVGTDIHHDLTYLAQSDGTLIGNRAYDPFGQLQAATGTITTSLGYQSDLTDPTTGDVWMGARWYGPSQDTFLSQDSVTGQLSDPGTLNRYTYVEGDPLTGYDPTGNSRADDGATAVPDLARIIRAEHAMQQINRADAQLKASRGSSIWQDLAVTTTGTFDGVTFGLTKTIRKQLGTDDPSLYSSTLYKQSHAGGTVAGLALTVVDGGIAVVANAGKIAKLAKGLRAFPALIREAGSLRNLTRQVLTLAKAAARLHLASARDALLQVVSRGRSATGAAMGAVRAGGAKIAGALARSRPGAGAAEGASMPLHAAGSLTNAEARAFYLQGESHIAALGDDLAARGVSARSRALELIGTRNALRSQSRALMADREMADLLNATDPNRTLGQLVSRAYGEKGLVGDDLWNYLADSASRSRASVNALFGL